MSAWAAAIASTSATGSTGVSSGALLLPSLPSLDSLSLLSRSTPSAPSYPACRETKAETGLAHLACYRGERHGHLLQTRSLLTERLQNT